MWAFAIVARFKTFKASRSKNRRQIAAIVRELAVKLQESSLEPSMRDNLEKITVGTCLRASVEVVYAK
jgi:hypothetical protein